MFSVKIYTTKNKYFLQNSRKQMACVQKLLCFNFYNFAENIVCTILALVICAITIGELKFLKNTSWQIILHIFIKNLYPRNNQ